ncbi:CIC11C00000000895 [Sungouiella intermedia]|uniref:DNA primase large subunit n=1 Tax=Sungouiella intermedia TaxID=45354 RepID=A0A1L0DDZ7_9ASCO|nr:CIC11C00000000895 [[Candida] intermedia]
MFRQTKRRTAGRRNFEEVAAYAESSRSVYPSRLSFYDLPPLEEITLEEFESWAIDRLKILIEIESCLARSKSLKEIEAVVKPLLLKFLPLTPSTTSGSDDQVIAERRKDYYSHYTLRLVFCRTEELRKKFVKNETTLFKIRYNMLQPKEQHEFVKLNSGKLSWEYISNEEKLEKLESLLAASGPTIKTVFTIENAGDANFNITQEQLRQHIRSKESFIKLPFEKVPSLVSLRQVYLERGYAFIPSTLQVSLLSMVFSELLTLALLRTFQALPRLEEDDRLLPLLNNLSRNFASIQYDSFGENGANSDITADTITTSNITKHFPLCATHLQKNLILSSHLKYGGRQQLGLFLKGIGLNVDEALKFWSYQFTKSSKMNMDSFNKEYKYNVRHVYGLEGGRINYKPWDCNTILLKPKPQKGEYHGCPYRDLSVDALVNNLNEMGVVDQHDINGIVEDVNKHDYTVACTRVFELTHKQQMDRASKPENLHITHPNLYFDRSRQLEKGDKATAVN